MQLETPDVAITAWVQITQLRIVLGTEMLNAASKAALGIITLCYTISKLRC
jgi:hypothetical protein